MNPLRSVGGQLALALIVVVGGALVIVYLIVVPSYESSLVNSKLKDLRHTLALIEAAPRVAPGEVFPSDSWLEDEALPVAGGATPYFYLGDWVFLVMLLVTLVPAIVPALSRRDG